MSQAARPRRPLRSIAAVIAGVLAVILLSVGTDAALGALRVFPPVGQSMSDWMLLIATIYRTIYAIVGGYIAARLAPDRPMMHALISGAVGLAASIAGVVATWNTEAAIGHQWYPLALVVLALPPAWFGGRLQVLQFRSQVKS